MKIVSRVVPLLLGLVTAAGAADVSQISPPPITSPADLRSDRTAVYQVPLYKATIVPLRSSARRVSVGNPGVADILVIRSQELYVVGKALGSTNVVVWDDAGKVVAGFDVEVTHDLETLKTKLHQLLPGERINVYSAQEQIVLGGQVSSAARVTAAKDLATGFLPDCIQAQSDAPGAQKSSMRVDASCKKGSIVNLMQVGGANQVMLKVTVAEMARSVVKKLDSNLNFMNFGSRFSGGAVSGGASFPDALDEDGLARLTQGALVGGGLSPIGPHLDLFAPTTPVIDDTGMFLGYLSGDLFVEAVLDISKRKGLAKILSEPTLTTMTGQEAQFLSGGEFPIPVPQGGGSNSVTIEFKEFGIGVKFLPVVLDSGRINLAVNVSVSELAAQNNVVLQGSGTTSTFLIPSLTKRSAASVVELGDGQTIGIAGLINDNVREFVDKFPGLGDLPLIGALFRSQEFVSGKTELVMFVTPRLAKPIAPESIRLPTDTYVEPGDLEFYLLGSMDHSRDRPEPSKVVSREAPPKGTFGHARSNQN